MHQPAIHRAILIIDVENFSDPSRTNAHQLAIRDGMYKALRQSFAKSQISWSDCAAEDRGDGVLVLIPPKVPKIWLVTKLPDQLAGLLERQNAACPARARFRLRMAVHAGEIHQDAHGFTGTALNHAFRLIESSASRAALQYSAGMVALIISNWFYDELVRHQAIANSSDFRQVGVATKDIEMTAWIRVPEPRAASRNTRPSGSAVPGGTTAREADSALIQLGNCSVTASRVQALERQPGHALTESRIQLYRVKDQPLGTQSRNIGIVTGDLRHVRCADVWVNPENTEMKMSRTEEFSISAIIRYEGARRDQAGHVIDDIIADELARKVAGMCPVAAATAITTSSGALARSHNARYVIHVAAVQGEPGAGYRQIQEIGRCVTNALTQAARLSDHGHPMTTILFPLLGTGQGGGNLDVTVPALLGAALDYLTVATASSITTVYFLAYTNTELAACQEEFRANSRLRQIGP